MAVVFTIYAGLGTPGDDSPDRPARNRAVLLDLLKHCHPDGFTVVDGIGCWEGIEEPGASVIFIAPVDENADALEERVCDTAQAYKIAAEQQEVWITRRREILAVL